MPALETFSVSEATLLTCVWMVAATSCPFSQGRADLIKPATPVTNGADAEVPETVQYPPPICVVRTFVPGAATVTLLSPQFDHDASRSTLSVAATALRLCLL